MRKLRGGVGLGLAVVLASTALGATARADDAPDGRRRSYLWQTLPFDVAGSAAMLVGAGLTPSNDTRGWVVAGMGAALVAVSPSVVHAFHGRIGWGLLRFGLTVVELSLGLGFVYAGTHPSRSGEDCNIHPDACGSPSDVVGAGLGALVTMTGLSAVIGGVATGMAFDGHLALEKAPPADARHASSIRLAPIPVAATPGGAPRTTALGVAGQF